MLPDCFFLNASLCKRTVQKLKWVVLSTTLSDLAWHIESWYDAVVKCWTETSRETLSSNSHSALKLA